MPQWSPENGSTMTDTAIDTGPNPYLQPMDWGTAPPMVQPVDRGTGPIPMTPPVDNRAPPAPMHLVQGQPGINQLERPPPAAIQTTPPPTPGVSPGLPFDDEQEFNISLQNEADAIRKNKIDTLRGEPSFAPQLIDPTQDERLKEIEELRKLLPGMTPKERRQFNVEINATQNRIMREIREKNTAQTREADKLRADQLRSASAPFQDVEKREKTANVIASYIGPMIGKYTTGLDPNDVDPSTGKPKQFDMNNPAIKSALTYTYRTSPLSTLKPIELRDVVTNIAMANPNISNDAALRYTLAIGSPAEMRKEWMDPNTGQMRQGDPNAPGPNGHRGKGAANYRVLGRDPNRDMVVVQVGPQQLRIDNPTYQRLVQARVMGYTTARKLMEEQAKAATEPTVFQRAAKPVQENIIKPAEEFIQRFR